MIMTRAVDISIHAVSPLFIDALLLAAVGSRPPPRTGGADPAGRPAPPREWAGRLRRSCPEPGPIRIRTGVGGVDALRPTPGPASRGLPSEALGCAGPDRGNDPIGEGRERWSEIVPALRLLGAVDRPGPRQDRPV